MKQRQAVDVVQLDAVRGDGVCKCGVDGRDRAAVANQRRLAPSACVGREASRDPAAVRLTPGERDAEVIEHQRAGIVDQLLRDVAELEPGEVIREHIAGCRAHGFPMVSGDR